VVALSRSLDLGASELLRNAPDICGSTDMVRMDACHGFAALSRGSGLSIDTLVTRAVQIRVRTGSWVAKRCVAGCGVSHIPRCYAVGMMSPPALGTSRIMLSPEA